jgi:hypothetical protein
MDTLALLIVNATRGSLVEAGEKTQHSRVEFMGGFVKFFLRNSEGFLLDKRWKISYVSQGVSRSLPDWTDTYSTWMCDFHGLFDYL